MTDKLITLATLDAQGNVHLNPEIGLLNLITLLGAIAKSFEERTKSPAWAKNLKQDLHWSCAPLWAMWHAFDDDTKGYWYRDEPAMAVKGDRVWQPVHRTDMPAYSTYVASNYNLKEGRCWTRSLSKRPDSTKSV